MKPSKRFGVLLMSSAEYDDEIRMQMALYIEEVAFREHQAFYREVDSQTGTLFVNRASAIAQFHEWHGESEDGSKEEDALIQLINLFEKEFSQPFVIFIDDDEVTGYHDEEHSEDG